MFDPSSNSIRRLPPGAANQMIEQGLRAHAAEQASIREQSFLPDGAGPAQRDVERAEIQLEDDIEIEKREREHLEAVNAQVSAAAEVRTLAERAAMLAQQNHEAALQAEQDAFVTGAEVIAVDVAAARAASESAARRVAVLRQEELKAQAPITGARAAHEGAVDRRREAAFKLARAKLAAAAVLQCELLVSELRPLLQEAEAAARAGFRGGPSALRSVSGVRDAITYALAPVLSMVALKAMPAAPRRVAARIMAEAEESVDEHLLVDAVVVAGNSYGKFRAGERVRVTPAELELQSRRGRDGQRMGALMSLDEWEQIEALKSGEAAEAEQQSPKFLSAKIKSIVEAGIDRFSREAREKRAARVAAEAGRGEARTSARGAGAAAAAQRGRRCRRSGPARGRAGRKDHDARTAGGLIVYAKSPPTVTIGRSRRSTSGPLGSCGRSSTKRARISASARGPSSISRRSCAATRPIHERQ